MRIRVKLYSWFREYLPAKANGEATVELPEGATIAHLLSKLGIALHIESIVVNNDPEPDTERILRDDDKVSILPLVPGG
jgi:sulfur carrier protein ThiS